MGVVKYGFIKPIKNNNLNNLWNLTFYQQSSHSCFSFWSLHEGYRFPMRFFLSALSNINNSTVRETHNQPAWISIRDHSQSHEAGAGPVLPFAFWLAELLRKHEHVMEWWGDYKIRERLARQKAADKSDTLQQPSKKYRKSQKYLHVSSLQE